LRTRPQDQRGGKSARTNEPRRKYLDSRKGREWLYGRNAVREVLRAGRRNLFRIVFAEGLESDARLAEIERLARAGGLSIERLPREVVDNTGGPGHQGVLLEASEFQYATDVRPASLAKQRAIVLALDGIEDPRNAGTLLRTAEAVGVAAVVIPSNRAVGITSAVVNASSGAVEHLQVIRETNLARWLTAAREAGFWVLGLAGDEESQPLFESDAAAPVVLVVGSEGRGLRRLTREQCDLLVSLPMVGKVESLNAAVAGSIALYEIFRDTSESAQEGR
jgi:23S rRNA (guanosine2251-2'-O)-methyltransferase